MRKDLRHLCRIYGNQLEPDKVIAGALEEVAFRRPFGARWPGEELSTSMPYVRLKHQSWASRRVLASRMRFLSWIKGMDWGDVINTPAYAYGCSGQVLGDSLSVGAGSPGVHGRESGQLVHA